MPVFTNDITNSKTIKIENASGSRGIYLIWDDVNENLLTTIVNSDPTYVPVPMPSESMFIYDDLGIEKINEGEFPSSDVQYRNIKLIFDGLLGSSTTLQGSDPSSVTNVLIEDNNNFITFDYKYRGISDTFTIISYNKDNSRSKTFTRTFELRQTMNTPRDWGLITPNQQGYSYVGLQMEFYRDVVSIGNVSSQLGGTITDVVIVAPNKVQFNYTAPISISDPVQESITDIISFADVNDGNLVNSSPVSRQVVLLYGPRILGWDGVKPNKQNYQYTGLKVLFTKQIQTINSVTVSGVNGGTIGNVVVSQVENAVSFDWLTGSATSPELIFNGLSASDGTIDIDLEERLGGISLLSGPSQPSWYNGVKPSYKETTYENMEVYFSEEIILYNNVAPSVSTDVADDVISGVSINARGNLVFTINTSANYTGNFTFTNIYGQSGGFTSSLTLGIGPVLQLIEVDRNVTGSGDPDYVQYQPSETIKVVVGYNTRIKLTFNSTLQTPVISGFTPDNANATDADVFKVYTMAPLQSIGQHQKTSNTIISTDGTPAGTITLNFDALYPQTIVSMKEQGQNVELTSIDQDTPYTIEFLTSKEIFDDGANMETLLNGHVVTRTSATQYLVSGFSIAEASNNQELTLTKAKDIDSFVYNLVKYITVNAVFNPYVDISGLVSRFDAGITDTITLDGSNVISWKDSIGTSEVSQSISNYRPTLVTQKGRNAVNFDSSLGQHLYFSGTNPSVSIGTMIFVYNNTSVKDASSSICYNQTNSALNLIHGGGGGKLFLAGVSDLTYPSGNVIINGVSVDSSTVLRTAVSSISVQSNAFTQVYTNMYLRTIGSSHTDHDNRSMNGKMCEILIYDRILSDTELNTISAYLTNKWI